MASVSPPQHLEFHERTCRCGRSGCGELRGGNPAHVAITKRGAFEVHVGQQTCLARPGAAILASPEIEYRVSHPGEFGHDYMIVALPTGVWEQEDLGRAGPGAHEIAYDLTNHWRMLLAARRLRDAGADRLEQDEAARVLVDQALNHRDLGPRPPAGARRSQEVRVAEREIAGAFNENIGLGALADQAGCSPFHLSRRFRRETGLTTAQYRMRLRLGHALERLIAGDEPLTGLALDLGFASHSHLTAACTRLLGRSPQAIRQSARSERADLRDRLRRAPTPD